MYAQIEVSYYDSSMHQAYLAFSFLFCHLRIPNAVDAEPICAQYLEIFKEKVPDFADTLDAFCNGLQRKLAARN